MTVMMMVISEWGLHVMMMITINEWGLHMMMEEEENLRATVNILGH